MILMLGMFLAAAAPADNPLAPAEGGSVQCYHPDTAKKTCRSLASYRRKADGSYDNDATVLLAPSPIVLMMTTTPVAVDHGAVCGTLGQQDIDAARISVNGQALDGDTLAQARQQIGTALATMIGKRICTTYVPDGATLKASVTMDGAATPQGGDTVLWVKPGDGYSVAP